MSISTNISKIFNISITLAESELFFGESSKIFLTATYVL